MTAWKRLVDRLWGYPSSRQFAVHADDTITLHHNSGFFSNCSVLLMSIANANRHPARLDVSASFTHFTERGKSFQWSEFFCPPPAHFRQRQRHWKRSRVAHRLPHHSVYKLLDYSVIGEIRDTYFRVSPTVEARAKQIQQHHLPVPLDQLLVVCLRGTDKASEVRQSPMKRYVTYAQRVMKRHPEFKVWIQTDQAQIRDYLLKQLGHRSFALDLLPVTETSHVIHRSEAVGAKAEFSQNLLATTWLMSQAHSVITYTGNVGYWIAIFRGHARRLYQLR